RPRCPRGPTGPTPAARRARRPGSRRGTRRRLPSRRPLRPDQPGRRPARSRSTPESPQCRERLARHDSSPSGSATRKNGRMADIPPSFRLSVPDDFGVEVDVDGGDVVVTVRGELDVLTAPFLWERMEPVLDGVTGKLVFDFAELGFIDSMGLGVIVRAQ